MTPADFKAALVEAMSKAACCPSGECRYKEHCIATYQYDKFMERMLASLPPVLERFGCKILGRQIGEREAVIALDGTAAYLNLPGSKRSQNIEKMRLRWSAAWDAAPPVAWEE